LKHGFGRKFLSGFLVNLNLKTKKEWCLIIAAAAGKYGFDALKSEAEAGM
jgi:hypothetical protein